MPRATFAPDHEAFVRRIVAGRQQAAQTALVARAHLTALENRVAQAAAALELGHLGSARAFLEIGQRDFQAALQILSAS